MIHKALRLQPRDRARALRGLAWLVAADGALRLFPFATIARTIERIPPSRSARAALTPAECRDAVRRASRLWPGARCLPQAVAAYCLLRRGGREPALQLGARQDGGGRLDAHAWLECEGVAVTGGDVPGAYRVLRPSGHPQP